MCKRISMKKKYNILVVDDEPALCEIIAYNLQAAGYETTVCHSGEEALKKVENKKFDLVLLDVMMGGMSGFDVAKKMKADESFKDIPIIFLTAKDTEYDILKGFDIGADDYISKPFRVKEVVARCQAVLRRSEQTDSSSKGFVIDDRKKVLIIDGEEILLGPTEFAILSLLVSNPGRVYSRQELIEMAWPKDVIVMENTVNVLINRLRHKMGPYAQHIVARPGFGYLYQ